MFNDDLRRRKIRPRPSGPPLPPDISMPPPPAPTQAGIPGGVMPPDYAAQSRGEFTSEARDAYLQKTPGRLKSGLLSALQGFAEGGLGGAAIGGAFGAIDPRGFRERQFEQRIEPRIRERFAYEDQQNERTRQAGRDRREDEYRAAQTRALDRQHLPQASETPFADSPLGIYDRRSGVVTTPAPPKEQARPAPQMKLYRNRKTGRFAYLDSLDPQTAVEHDAYVRPFAVGKGAKPKEPKKVISITKIREAAAASGGRMSESDVKARFMEQGYQIAN